MPDTDTEGRMTRFTALNTEGYSEADLTELNRRFHQCLVSAGPVDEDFQKSFEDRLATDVLIQFEHDRHQLNLRSTVREALDNSLVNGFDPRKARDAKYLADDLCELDADLEGVDPSEIMPFVQEWLVDHR